ncbi:MAG: NTP transferase domain-containing protein [Casimicrobiaceae bacterium]
MRYLILAAGMGTRLGDAGAGMPKCLIEVNGETLIARLLRQIRSADPAADIHVVLGFRSEAVVPAVDGCRIIINPFFDLTGINASLWFARESFDRPLMLIHADLLLADDLAHALLTSEGETLMAFDSTLRDPAEVNVAVAADRVIRFDENFAGYTGLYAGALKLSLAAARAFAETLDRRVRQGFNEPRDYYFFVVRAIIEQYGIPMAAFDFAGRAWQEIDRAEHIVAARARFGEAPLAIA